MSEGITHTGLVERAEKWLQNTVNCGVVFNDSFRAATLSGECPDAIGFRAGISILVECKASRSDFLADKKKSFRANPEMGIGDWRFYMCPPGVINIEDLPDDWGLLWVTGKTVRKIHGYPANTRWFVKPFTGNRDAELRYMYSALRRLTINGHFNTVYETPWKEISEAI